MKVKFKETGIVVVKACACGEEIRSSVGGRMFNKTIMISDI